MMSRTREVHPLKILATTVGAALLVLGLLLAYASSPAWAAQITVNSLEDDADGQDGECTLREAITSANTDTASGDPATGECAAGSGHDVIQFVLPGNSPWILELSAGLPNLSTNMNIQGPGPDQLTVRRNSTNAFRIFTVAGNTTVVAISGMTISNGIAPDGGGILNDGGTLTVSGSTISDNTAVSSSHGRGGGISNLGTLTVSGSTISGNTATGGTDPGSFPLGGEGGGIHNGAGNAGTMTVTDSTISDNTATAGQPAVGDTEGEGGRGGGIYNESAEDADCQSLRKITTITNSTISGNSAAGISAAGGGIHNDIGPTVIKHSTITLNTAPDGTGSGAASSGDFCTSTTVLSSIISANQGTDVDSVFIGDNSFISNGYNLIGDGNAAKDDDPNTPVIESNAFDQTGDQTGVTDPKLGVLAENGGLTMTHALLAGSPAIDKGNSAGQSTDQRGEPRPFDDPDVEPPTDGDNSDIGAFEAQEALNAAPTVTVARGGACGASNLQGTINLTLSDPDTPAQDLILSATSSEQAVVPNANITFGGGTDLSRTMTVSAIQAGASTVTVTLSDGDLQEDSVPLRVRVGTSSNNTLSGGANADMILARSGSDTASGFRSLDLLCGHSGNDTLSGGGERDTLRGGNNDDTLTGGPRADKFVGGAGTDTATDFNAAEGDTQSAIP
jgi:CSLREA domain-containing protein